MLTLGVYCSIPDLSQVDLNEVLGALHEHAEEIADTILHRIEDRTPVDTGALKEDETYVLGPDKATLVTWFVGDAYQLTEWNRVYAPYQEGPPLGIAGYTASGAPVRMFERVATDDQPLIQSWADAVVGEALNQLTLNAQANAQVIP